MLFLGAQAIDINLAMRIRRPEHFCKGLNITGIMVSCKQSSLQVTSLQGLLGCSRASPLASPMQYTLGTGLPLLSRTCICSPTGTNPLLSVSASMAARFRPCRQ